MAIPKSVHEERIKENFNVFDFKLTTEEIEKILALNIAKRVYMDPDNRPGVPEEELPYFPEEF